MHWATKCHLWLSFEIQKLAWPTSHIEKEIPEDTPLRIWWWSWVEWRELFFVVVYTCLPCWTVSMLSSSLVEPCWICPYSLSHRTTEIESCTPALVGGFRKGRGARSHHHSLSKSYGSSATRAPPCETTSGVRASPATLPGLDSFLPFISFLIFANLHRRDLRCRHSRWGSLNKVY